jgi:chromosome segregation ATPase
MSSTGSVPFAGLRPAPPGTSLLDVTQRDLDTLRATIDERLVALEQALANPDGPHSLETLIADLARLATTEAQAAATWTCQTARRDTEAAILDAHARAGADIATERSAAADLRASLQDAQRRIASLERERQRAVETEQEQAQVLAGERSWHADVERTVTRLRQELEAANRQLEIERTQNAELAQAHETERDAERADSVRLQSEADRNRASLTTLQAELDAERSFSADLQGELMSERHTMLQLRSDLDMERGNVAALRSERDTERDHVSRLRTELDGERAATAQFRAHAAAHADASGEAQSALARLHADFHAQSQRLAELDDELREEKEGRAAEADALSALRAEVADLEQLREREELTSALQAERLSAERLRASMREAEQRASGLEEQHRSALEAVETGREALEQARALAAALAGERDTLTQAIEAARDQIAQLGARRGRGDVAADGEDWTELNLDAAISIDEPPAAGPAELPQPERPGPSKRYTFAHRVDIKVDNAAATLADLSMTGCRVRCANLLQKEQFVRIVLPQAPAPIVCFGRVAWTRLDDSRNTPGCVAGVLFTQCNHAAIEEFIIVHGDLTNR